MFKQFDNTLSPTRALVANKKDRLQFGGTPFSSVFDAFFGDTLGDWGFDYGADQFTELYLDETETHYIVEVDLPGFALGDVSIEAKDGVLTLYAEHKDPENSPAYKALRKERNAERGRASSRNSKARRSQGEGHRD